MSTNGQAVAEHSDVAKAASDMVEIGSTGLVQYHGVIDEERRTQLRTLRDRIAVWSEMGRYPTVGAVLFAIDNLIRRVEWSFDPAPDSGAEGERWAEHCTSCMDDMSASWADTMSDIFSLVQYGFAYSEVVLKRRLGEQPDRPGAKPSSDYDDGLVGWRKIELRSQDSVLRWEFEDGSLRGMWQQVEGGRAKFIPIEKAALFRTRSHKNNPEGRSLLWSAFDAWWPVKRIKEIEGIGIERDLAGLPVGRAPEKMLSSTASEAQKQAVAGMKRTLSNIRRNAHEGLLWPLAYDDNGNELYKLELLSSGGQRQFDTNAVIARYNAEIAMCVLADWLMLGHDAVGSKALASVRIDQFNAALETLTRGVADVFDAHITPRLLRANGVSAKLAPRMRAGKITQTDLAAFATVIADLVSSGALTNDTETENHTRTVIGYPPLPEDTEPVEPAAESATLTPRVNTDVETEGEQDAVAEPATAAGGAS